MIKHTNEQQSTVTLQTASGDTLELQVSQEPIFNEPGEESEYEDHATNDRKDNVQCRQYRFPSGLDRWSQ